MAVIITNSQFCYIECDHPGCNRKIEHNDEGMLAKLADWSGWKRKETQWLCKSCSEVIKNYNHES